MSTSKSIFSTSRRGYAPEEVDEYLLSYVSPLEEEMDAARAQVLSLEAELEAARDRDEAMQVTLLAATKTKDEFVADAASRTLRRSRWRRPRLRSSGKRPSTRQV